MVKAITPIVVCFETPFRIDINDADDFLYDMLDDIRDAQHGAFTRLHYVFDFSEMEDGNFLFKYLDLEMAGGEVMSDSDYVDFIDSHVEKVAAAMEAYLKGKGVDIYRRVAVKPPTPMKNFSRKKK